MDIIRFYHICKKIQVIKSCDSQETISKLYGMYLAQTKHLRKTEYYQSQGKLQLLDIATKAITTTFQATKRKKSKTLLAILRVF